MKKKLILSCLVLALTLQAGMLVLVVARSENILRNGQLYNLRIKGYDPVDLLRGRFIQFELADINSQLITSIDDRDRLVNKSFYVYLKKNRQGYAIIGRISRKKETTPGWLRVEYDNNGYYIPPVSRFYLNEEDAKRAEKLILRSTVQPWVKVKLKDGQLLIQELIIGKESFKIM